MGKKGSHSAIVSAITSLSPVWKGAMDDTSIRLFKTIVVGFIPVHKCGVIEVDKEVGWEE